MSNMWIEVKGKQCFYCQYPAETIDHYIPLSRGGYKTKPNNQVPACKLCNGTKGNAHPSDFIEFMTFVKEEGSDLHTLSRSQRRMMKYRFQKKTGISIGPAEEMQTIVLSREERLKALANL